MRRKAWLNLLSDALNHLRIGAEQVAVDNETNVPSVNPRDLALLQVLNAMPELYPFRQEAGFQGLLTRIGMPERLRK